MIENSLSVIFEGVNFVGAFLETVNFLCIRCSFYYVISVTQKYDQVFWYLFFVGIGNTNFVLDAYMNIVHK